MKEITKKSKSQDMSSVDYIRKIEDLQRLSGRSITGELKETYEKIKAKYADELQPQAQNASAPTNPTQPIVEEGPKKKPSSKCIQKKQPRGARPKECQPNPAAQVKVAPRGDS